MFRSLFIILLLALCKPAFCQTAADFNDPDFTLFPKYKEDAEYFANVIPDSTYLYWRCVFNAGPYFRKYKDRVIFETGDKKYAKLTKKYKVEYGFMRGCPPGFCSYYIIAVRSDKTILQVNSPETFKTFLGKIDNLDEVRLVVKDHNYTVYSNSIKSGSYRERKDDYLLLLGGYSSDLISNTPVSTKAVLTKAGDFRIIESGTY